MADRKELIQRLQKIQAEAAAIEAELAKPEEPKTWTRWKPEVGQRYWFLTTQRDVMPCIWTGGHVDKILHQNGNCYATETLAWYEVLRQRSMIPRCPMPKEGDTFYYVLAHVNKWSVEKGIWSGKDWQVDLYNLGRIDATKDGCEEWLHDHKDYWTMKETKAHD